MYKILFIDEEQETLDDFKDYVDASSTKDNIDVITQFPLESIEEMMELIFKENPDAVVTDFKLNEMKTDIKYNIPYNGVELIEELLKIRALFPCFVLTAFDDKAITASDDVNKIYIKNILHNPKEESRAKVNFLDRIINQIEHYKAKIHNAEKEIIELIELRNEGKAKISDEERIIELDHFLEKVIDGKHSIPMSYKSLSNDERLGELLYKVDQILKKVDDGD